MRIRVPDYYKNFNCISSSCTDTCCAGWEVVIDDSAYHYYQSVTGKFGERLMSSIKSSEQENCFHLLNGNCAFLNENKLCDIYAELGKDKLCNTCKTYPRFSEEFGGLREVGISLSCPEAARLIILNSMPITFEIEKNNEIVSTYNTIDPDLFMQLLACRKLAIEILQNRKMIMEQRVALLLSFTKAVQEKIQKNKVLQLTDVRNKYAKEEFTQKFIKGLSKYNNKQQLKYQKMKSCIKILKELENINETWPLILDELLITVDTLNQENDNGTQNQKGFHAYYLENLYQYENCMIYFVFRYYLKAVFDENVFSKVKLALVSFLIIKEMGVSRWIKQGSFFEDSDQIDIMHLYSKEIEHSENNMDYLENIFETDPLFDYDSLMVMLLN